MGTSKSGKSKSKQSKKKAVESDVSDSDSECVIVEAKRRVSWKAKDHARTARLIDYLEEHPAFRHKLFSDSTRDAVEEGRRKQTAKSSKSRLFEELARHIFSGDHDSRVRKRHQSHPNEFVKATENHIASLKAQYRKFNQELGQTGAGLAYEDVTKDSPLWNKIETMKQDFPFWDRLHGFWRKIPSFNPFTVSSEPGQDLASSAEGILFNASPTGPAAHALPGSGSATLPVDPLSIADNSDIDADGEVDEDADGLVPSQASPYPAAISRLSQSPSAGPFSPIFTQSATTSTSPVFGNSSKLNVTAGKTDVKPSSKPTKPASRKRNHIEAFAEENQAQDVTLRALSAQKHERRMLELALKRQKVEMVADRERRQAEERERQAKREYDLEVLRIAGKDGFIALKQSEQPVAPPPAPTPLSQPIPSSASSFLPPAPMDDFTNLDLNSYEMPSWANQSIDFSQFDPVNME